MPKIPSRLLASLLRQKRNFVATLVSLLLASLAVGLVTVPLRLSSRTEMVEIVGAMAFGLQLVFLVALSWEVFSKLWPGTYRHGGSAPEKQLKAENSLD
jgi:phosphate/sulfate permease